MLIIPITQHGVIIQLSEWISIKLNTANPHYTEIKYISVKKWIIRNDLQTTKIIFYKNLIRVLKKHFQQ